MRIPEKVLRALNRELQKSIIILRKQIPTYKPNYDSWVSNSEHVKSWDGGGTYKTWKV